MKTLGTVAIAGLLLACLAWETEQLSGFHQQFRMDRARILKESRLATESNASLPSSRTARRPLPQHPAVAWLRDHLAPFSEFDLGGKLWWKEALVTVLCGWILSRALNSVGPTASS